jgi:hypothetical protein
MAPDAEPLFVTVHDAAEPGQYFSIAVRQAGRLIYAENYLFNAEGSFLRRDGFSDGLVGRQVLYSIYRLHFGNFAGLPAKILYGILGLALALALAVVSATGVINGCLLLFAVALFGYLLATRPRSRGQYAAAGSPLSREFGK